MRLRHPAFPIFVPACLVGLALWVYILVVDRAPVGVVLAAFLAVVVALLTEPHPRKR